MNINSIQRLYRRSFLVTFILFLAFVGLAVNFKSAAADLPERPTPVAAKKDRDKDDKKVAGAHIQLQANGFNGWSEVQWQDSDENWQMVEGWQGYLEDGAIMWWVHPKDFNNGPFRWVIYEQPGGALTAMSETFALPQSVQEVLVVTIVE